MRMMANCTKWSPVILLLLAACGEPRNLYMGAHTVVGINAAIDTQQTTGHIILGYRRDFAAVVPRSVPVDGVGTGRDAMSTLVCSELGVEGITIRRYTESLATGAAAQNFANAVRNTDVQATAIRNFFECFQKQERRP